MTNNQYSNIVSHVGKTHTFFFLYHLKNPMKNMPSASFLPRTHLAKRLIGRGRHIYNSRIITQHKKA